MSGGRKHWTFRHPGACGCAGCGYLRRRQQPPDDDGFSDAVASGAIVELVNPDGSVFGYCSPKVAEYLRKLPKDPAPPRIIDDWLASMGAIDGIKPPE